MGKCSRHGIEINVHACWTQSPLDATALSVTFAGVASISLRSAIPFLRLNADAGSAVSGHRCPFTPIDPMAPS